MDEKEFRELMERLYPKFLVLKDGEQIRARYYFSEDCISDFDPSSETTCYYFLYKDVVGILTSASRWLKVQMSKIPAGSLLLIERMGLGKSTRYYVRGIEENPQGAVSKTKE